MASPDVRRWLPPVGIAALVALTILDVVLIKLAFDHAEGPDRAPVDAVSSPAPTNTRAPLPSPSPAKDSPAPSAASPEAGLPDGPVLLALAPDGTTLRAAGGGCEAGADPQVALAGGGGRFRALPVDAELGGGVLALRAESRERLTVVGLDAECEPVTYTGGPRPQTWAPSSAEDEWYLDPTGETTVVHAPGGPVELPCDPVGLSTLEAVRVLCDNDTVIGTSDGGTSWVTLGRLESAAAVAFQGPGRGVGLASEEDCPVAVFVTDDGGASWESTTCLEGRRGRAVAVRDQVVVAVVDHVAWRSDDAGFTWEPMS